MQKVEALYRLQVVDLELEDKLRRLHEVESRLGESEELVSARQTRERSTQTAHDAENDLREREFEVSRTESKLKEVTTALYSGKTRPAKELSNLQKEADHLAQVKSKGEDEVLAAMDRLEELQAAAARARDAFAQADAVWREEQSDLQHQQRELQTEIETLKARREERLQAVDPTHIHTYDTLRRQKNGRAVAKVEQSVCSGCRVGLPVSQVQKARTNPGITYCSSCGRILFVAR